MLLLGLTAQAHAGEYVQQNNGWSLISATAPTSTSEAGPPTQSDSKTTTLQWNWNPNNAQDLPIPVEMRLTFGGTLGDCFVHATEVRATAWTEIYCGFGNDPEGSLAYLHNFTESDGGQPYTQPGAMVAASKVKQFDNKLVVQENAKVIAKTTARAYDPYDRSIAYSTTGQLSTFSLYAR